MQEHIVDIRETMHRSSGINEETAEGTVPDALKSGIAISNYVKVINQRLSQQHLGYQEDLWNQSARVNVALGPPKGKADDALSAQIDWDLLGLPSTAYKLSYEVVNDAVDHLPFRLDTISYLQTTGAIEVGEMLAHIEDGDLAAIEQRLNAERNYIEFQVSRALDDGEVEPPVPFQDPKKLAKSAGEAWLMAKASKVKPPRAHMDALYRLQRLAAGPGAPQVPAVAPPPALPAEAPAPAPEAPILSAPEQPLTTQLAPSATPPVL